MKTTKPLIFEAFRRSPLLRQLTELQMDRVYRHGIVKSLDEGQTLFSTGDPLDYFYLVISGKIKLFRVSPEGQEKIIEFVADGETFGEALMFLEKSNYPVSAAALDRSIVIGIRANDFTQMLWDSPGTSLALLGNLSFRLRKMIFEIDKLTLHTGTCRLAAYLLEIAPPGHEVFDLEVTKSAIAARLSVKPETLSRIIKHLRDEGTLEVSGKKFTILDRKRLQDLCLI